MRLGWVVIVCAPIFAAGFAGPDACNACHPAEYKTQIRSHHAFALRRASDTQLASMLMSQPLRERSGIVFEYEPALDGVRVTAVQGSRSASAVLTWAFGAGAQAMTPVGTVGGRFFEHRISYYSAPQAPRRTLGHPGEASKDPASALGVVQDADTIFRCFNCHGTGVRPGPDLSSIIPGVTCERCHGPAGDHVAGKASMTPAKLSREGVLELCGSCHRLPQRQSAAPEADDPLSIRFAPVGLTASACYRRSDTLSCVTCHNPHEDAKQEEGEYSNKCLTCHGQRNVCRAGQTDKCVGCHMQRRSPAPWLTFTDHRIRVYR